MNDSTATHRAKITEALNKSANLAAKQAALRNAYLRQLTASNSVPTPSSSLQNLSPSHTNPLNEPICNTRHGDLQLVSVTRADADFPLHALDDIIWRRKTSGVTRVRLECVEEQPKYDAWVPVIHNFYVTESGVEPYIPYFGDRKRNVHIADQCYKQMLVDAKIRSDCGPTDELSDGEFQNDGFVLPPKTEHDWYDFHAPEQSRIRAAMREAILEITEKHGKEEEVWRSLSFAFEIEDVRRLKYICDLAERRRKEAEWKKSMREKSRNYSKLVRRASTMPEPEPEPENLAELEHRDGSARGALFHFCFPCHQFGCHLHAGENVPPVLPVPDHSMEKRISSLRKSRKITFCSQTCFQLSKWEQAPLGVEEFGGWTGEELVLLRDAAMMFQLDPCNLAIVVGKTCRQVFNKIRKGREKKLILAMIEQVSAPRIVKKNQAAGKNGASSESDDEAVRRVRQRGKKKKSKNPFRAAKSTPNSGEEEDLQKRYRPCNHPGACTKSNSCKCALNGLKCELYCGCNSGRFREGTNGIFWDPPTEEELKNGIAIQCSRQFLGCRCKNGHCNSDSCPCYAGMRVCTPDVCESCECNNLSSGRGFRDGRCRNSAAITTRHKQTFVGKSTIHGFGLFAGDFFNKGDLVGIYCGRVMSPDLLEETLRAYQAKGMTYAFNLQDSLTLDAGPIGSKAKFLNHSLERQNCHARIERLRGDGIVVLKTAKPVEPGEEFLFNYNIVGEGGNDWILNGGDSDDSESSESSESPEEESPLESISEEIGRVAFEEPEPAMQAEVKSDEEGQ